MTPGVPIILGQKAACRARIPFFDLPEEMLAVQSYLIFRVPQLGQPKSKDQGEDCPAEKAVLESRRHGLEAIRL